MTKEEFVKEILKKGNIIVGLRLLDSYLNIYKIEKTSEEHDDLVNVEMLYHLGKFCRGKTTVRRIEASEIEPLFSGDYIVTEEFWNE